MSGKQRNKGKRGGNDNFFYDLRTGSNLAIYDKLHNGVRVIINYCHSENANPRIKNNGFWKFSFKTSLFNLGDEEYEIDTTGIGSWKEYECLLRRKFNAVKLVPVYMSGESDVILSTKMPDSCWDCSQIGFAFLTDQDVMKISDIYSARYFHKACRFLLDVDLMRYECYLNGDAYSLFVDDLRAEKNLLCKEGYLGCDFVINGIADDLPEEFVEDVIKSIPEFFAVSFMTEETSQEDSLFSLSYDIDPVRVGDIGSESNPRIIKILVGYGCE